MSWWRFPKRILPDPAEEGRDYNGASCLSEKSPPWPAGRCCPVCGGQTFSSSKILWPELVRQWGLTAEEELWIEWQQGFHCTKCRSNLRSMTLAAAILNEMRLEGNFAALCQNSQALRDARILEINEAGSLTAYLRLIPGHKIVKYPEVDMQALPYADASWDCVVHSDCLEHIPCPVQALRECHRVLTPGGFLAFTVPLLVTRMTRRRDKLPACYHGGPNLRDESYRVITEYGADVWTQVIEAGFEEARIVALMYPASVAVTARRKSA